MDIEYDRTERRLLWSLAVLGFILINGAFLYGLLRPEVRQQAFANPIAMALMAEAVLLMGAFSYLLSKWQVSRLSWVWFVLLSLAGSMAFALPVVLLWPRAKSDPRTST